MNRKKKISTTSSPNNKKKIRWQLTSKIVTMLVRPTWRTVICRENKLYDMQTGIVLLTDSRVIFRFTSGFVDNGVTQLTFRSFLTHVPMSNQIRHRVLQKVHLQFYICFISHTGSWIRNAQHNIIHLQGCRASHM